MKNLLYLSFFLSIIICVSTKAQTPSKISPKSPNAASLGVYGDYPVSHFTGIPDISIPIYEIKTGNIKVPIVLQYNPASVKPNESPGWVGLGWNLQSYGVITRQINNHVDDHSSNTDGGNPLLIETCAKYLEDPLWDQFSHYKYFFAGAGNDPRRQSEPCTDDFNFSFMGHSGRFIWTSSGWKVISDENITVTTPTTANGIEYLTCNSEVSKFPPYKIYDGLNPQCIKEFILTTEDGTKYYFGGSGAIEYTTEMKNDVKEFHTASSWYLTKIVDISNNTVNFTYKLGSPLCQFSFGIDLSYNESTSLDPGPWWQLKLNGYTQDFGGSDYINDDPKFGTFSGTIIHPIYLTKIYSANERVDFLSEAANDLPYPSLFYYDGNVGTGSPVNSSYLDFIFGKYQDIKNQKLTQIALQTTDGRPLKSFVFSYIDQPAQRLTLTGLQLKDNGQSRYVNYPVYTFEYNNNSIKDLPAYGGNKTDHWGYFNGADLMNLSLYYYSEKRKTNPNTVTTGLISTIRYPTGGFTDFIWESNSYSKCVSPTRNSVLPTVGNCGGCRIREIRSYPTASTTVPLGKTYYYVTNYTSGADVTKLPSSGILNGEPKYYFYGKGKTAFDENNYVRYYRASFSTSASYSYSSGSHIGYSEVVEINRDNSYTKNLYTNFDIDSNQKAHFDILPSYAGFSDDQLQYMKMSDLSQERGKPTDVLMYSSTDKLVKSTKMWYTDTLLRFNKYLRRYNWNFAAKGNAQEVIIFASAFKDYTYRYNVVKKEVTTCNIDGLNPITQTEYYEYNDFDQLKSVRQINGTSELKSTYKYPLDYYCGIQPLTFGTIPNMDILISKWIVNTPIEAVKYKNGNIIDAELNYYSEASGLILKKERIFTSAPIKPTSFFDSYYETIITTGPFGTSPPQKTSYFRCYNYEPSVFYDSYDANGNLRQFHNEGDLFSSYLWDSAKNLPTAKIENAKVNQVAYSSFELPFTSTNSGFYDGGWHGIYGPTWTVTPNAKNGSNSIGCQGNGAILETTGQVPAGKYKLSFWGQSYNGNPSAALITNSNINADNSPYNLPDYPSWRYLEFNITVINSATIQLQVNYGKIDELRLCPVDAQMTTYIYNPDMTISSQTDANGLATKYEYDGYGRLLRIRDNDGKVLKEMEYNYAH